jgi:hypothetical protein
MNSRHTIILCCIAVWFLTVWIAGSSELFVSPAGQVPAAVGLAFAVPLGVFLLLFRFSRPFRETVSAFPPVLLASLHGWRFVGMSFIMADFNGLLPPTFAWPAGLGDTITAFFAPSIAYQLAKRPTFVGSGWFVAWNIFAIADFISAVGLGILHQTFPSLFNATVSTGLMQVMPFALIPCFFVPLLGMTSIVMLYQARSGRRLGEIGQRVSIPGT